MHKLIIVDTPEPLLDVVCNMYVNNMDFIKKYCIEVKERCDICNSNTGEKTYKLSDEGLNVFHIACLDKHINDYLKEKDTLGIVDYLLVSENKTVSGLYRYMNIETGETFLHTLNGKDIKLEGSIVPLVYKKYKEESALWLK